MHLRSLNRISWPLIYLRVNIYQPPGFNSQILNTDFAKICISPKPSGAPMGKVPLQVLKEHEHQARQNLSAINFTATFAKTASSVTQLWRSVSTVSRLLLRGLKARFRRVPIPKELSGVAMKTPVTILRL